VLNTRETPGPRSSRLPSTNLRFLNGIMWDGREPNLKSQANNATLVHAQPKHPPTNSELRQIVDLETSLFTAQSEDNLAGSLIAQGARGGPLEMTARAFPGEVVEFATRDPRSGRYFASVTHGQFGPHLFYTDDPTKKWQQAEGPAFPATGSLPPRSAPPA